MSEGALRGVVFDLDGTLYSLGARRLRMAFALRRDLGTLRHLSRARGAIRGRVFPDRESLLRAFHEELARLSGIDVREAAEWYEHGFLVEFTRMLSRRARARPGLEALLDRLRGSGLRLAVLSDYGAVGERIEALGLSRETFDDLVASEDYGVLKPSPIPLLTLARKWGQEPGSIIVIGDRYDLDGKSAEEAGMGFAGVREGPFSGSRRTGFRRWSQVAEALERRSSGAAGSRLG